MSYPLPSLSDLASYSGRAENSYGLFVDEAIKQATLLFVIASGLEDAPANVNDAQLATYGILAMADSIYLAQPSAEAAASPFQSESIGSYSYAKANRSRILRGEKTGIDWFDLAVGRLRSDAELGIAYSQVDVSFGNLYRDSSGNLVVLGPAETYAADSFGADNIEIPKSDLPGWPS